MIISGYSPRAEKSLVLITGMLGSGRNTVTSVLEETGWYVADNLPPELIVRMVELLFEAGSPVERLAIVTGVCSHAFAGSLGEVLDGLCNEGCWSYVIFFDANDDTLIAHYGSVRRTHPLQGNGTFSQGIVAERQMLSPIKGMSDLVVDTFNISVRDLCRELEHQLLDAASKTQRVIIEPFEFKHGVPCDTNMFFDVRSLPNPYWIPELCTDRGASKAVTDYVLP